MVQLIVTPETALADEPICIRATGLNPFQVVTFTASLTDEKGKLFQSRAFYKANEAGNVALDQAAALGGDYVGVHPMGLFWSLKPVNPFRRLLKQDVMNSPFYIQLDIFDSLLLEDSPKIHPKASQMIERWFSGPGLQRIPVRNGRVRGAFFLPPGEGPFPGVIDLFGGIGGLIEFRASLLASHGFGVLALAYFAYEDLPRSLLEVDLEYFEEAANMLLHHPQIQRSGIGVISVCKGAEIGLAMAIHLEQVAATICINGTNAVHETPCKYRDLVISPIPHQKEYTQIHVSGALNFRRIKGDPRDEVNQQSVLPVEKARGHILFIVGEKDECLNSKAYAEQAMEQLKSHGRSNGTLLSYPGAGHLIEPPYSPLCFASWNPFLSRPFLWGGDIRSHAAAQEHSWREIQKFLRCHLAPSRSKL
ncbi:acyl-coenzyme A amino acid N-acyltransferase 2-like [Monodelphis domestica]|uniref:acyl-coenzyme A amino acid N-acyltransferase 2-like n=1 Tax=Monodelphis domestica TaxID=13616 RepID=UPI0024E1FB4A|nr:acyl-coenzyme A amino acid N-acyltransferase 2-like [Monodelphis domestica]XP_056661269.1 acyl-coenzyme A amino acid N-acyltransferase 2-like [Monodelphis domestica]XP_056661270.1 acyl-coenzyme A amino acid N-acyltransferase 2-like [Monodelphis domestica]